jgi:hypothetical protein
MTTSTQEKAILADLQAGKRITPLDALTTYGCLRLAPRILDLRRKGVPIERDMVETANGKRVAEYRLGEVS